MSNITLTSTLSPELGRWMIGFDRLFDTLNHVESWNNTNASRGSYPPYNIILRSYDHYAIELAVSGFGEEDLEVAVSNGVLTVTGDIKQQPEQEETYLHRGLSRRKFQREWTLVEYVEVVSATVANGIMTIELERQLPDSLKPRAVSINFVR